MALLSSILGTKQRVQFIKNNVTILTLDASINEDHTRESPPTEFPVESGKSISDHIIIKPYALELKGLISDAPISILGSAITTGVGAITPPVIGNAAVAAGQAIISAINNDQKPSKTAYQQLVWLQEKREPFDVITTLTKYSNMFIKSLKIPRDATTGQALYFELSLMQLILISPAIVNIKAFSNPLVSSPAVDEGSQDKNILGRETERGIQEGWAKPDKLGLPPRALR